MDRKPLESRELIDLFKHWDTRVSHHELLFVPLAAAGLPAVAVAWKDITPRAMAVIALASVATYLLHLYTIRRIAVFQFNIYHKLGMLHSDFDEVVGVRLDDFKYRIGVQRLRVLSLPVLSLLWVAIILARVNFKLSEHAVVFSVLFLGATLLFFRPLWKDTTKKN